MLEFVLGVCMWIVGEVVGAVSPAPEAALEVGLIGTTGWGELSVVQVRLDRESFAGLGVGDRYSPSSMSIASRESSASAWSR